MNDKILFLDFDGVITNDASLMEYSARAKKEDVSMILSRGCVAMIEIIMIQTGCDVVFSTNWRHEHSDDQLYEFLVEAGMTLPRERFIDRTLRRSMSSSHHGIEIKEYYDSHYVGSFAILDDEDQGLSHYFKEYDSNGTNIDEAKWIRTNTNSGLLKYQMFAAIAILGRTPEAQAAHDEYQKDLELLTNVMF